jgi:membrane-bound lytic murein transglycosylase B
MKPSLIAGGVVCVLAAVLLGPFAASGGIARVVRPRSGMPARQSGGPLAAAPAGASRLADEINRAQGVIDDRTSSRRDLAAAALVEQLATGTLAGETRRVRQATLALLRPPAAATVRTDLAASASLSRLTVPEKRFPPWRIAEPPGPGTLLGYFREAQSRFGIGWQYLAAIEFIETRFGRVHGPSTAGAQGPMQFLPSTWSTYGRGNIDNQRDAILGAARFLVANGARNDMAGALYRYNNSDDYVAAVQDYAQRMRVDPRAYAGYYNWQVIYARADGAFLLPVGYPRIRPERVQYR